MFEVFLKEVKELLRDRKTLFFVIALPIVIFPILFALLGFLASKTTFEAEQKVHTYYLANADLSPEFAQMLFYHKSFKPYEGDEQFDSIEALKAAVKAGKIDVGIEIPKMQNKQVSVSPEQAVWHVVFNDAQSINFVYKRLEKLINKYAAGIRSATLEALGAPKAHHSAILKPITITKVDTADKRENYGEKLGALIPYMLIPLVLMGASYPAIDLGAGEKERGTLETLLLTPVTRTQLVLGKFLTILTSSIACALVTVSSMAIWISIAGGIGVLDTIKDAFSSVSIADFMLIFALLLPVAVMLSSLVLAISIYARSFKEAQNYMGPLSMLVFVPIVVSVMPNMSLNTTTAWIPITNVSLAIKEIIKGTVDYSAVMMIFVASALLAGALLMFCIRWFSKESVLFR
ncbi:ABC transporter permease [Pseudoalteromonas luteoviolacea]|uniref:ABC transporter permease n=1 Tax=Pseudoalteromonas luteoviolacea TaxID=43657 RepID=UPI001B3A23CA|nr:ABC transporter permease [Pseudoalteromonas luteoviolacea]MBQ4879413.1 ABC transporter permease [Pseudoalteromonas luteoviolacea]MBQ4908473.1 ABC transporter permease [Pseudoalteromonas luteoviolacea]